MPRGQHRYFECQNKNKVFDINNVPWQLRPLLEEFEDIFPDTLPQGLPPSGKVGTGQDMHIEVQNGTQPQWRAAYKTSPGDAKIMQTQIEELITQGRIRPSTSPWSAGTILVGKKDADGLKTGDWMCGDYRPLNCHTVPDRSPLPKVEELMIQLKGARFFFKVDLQSGYHQIRLDEASIPLTAFTTPTGHYEWLVFNITTCRSTGLNRQAGTKGPLKLTLRGNKQCDV